MRGNGPLRGGSAPSLTCQADAVRVEDGGSAPQPLTVTYFGTSTLVFGDGRDRILIDGFFSRPRLGTLLTSALVSDDGAIGDGLGETSLPFAPSW